VIKPGKRKLLLFAALSVVYAGLALLLVGMIAIKTCSMQPDVAAMCDTMPIVIAAAAAVAIYAALAVLFFRSRISGVD
jgi:hypothetical protein